MVDPKTLRELLNYNPETGVLTWKERGPEWFNSGARDPKHSAKQWNSAWAGVQALASENAYGYLTGAVTINGKRHGISSHVAAWAICTGRMPTGEIDHKDGNKKNNRIQNLRDVPRDENLRNMPKRQDNKTGVTGVQWNKTNKNWRAIITHKGKRKNLGSFKNKDDAIRARRDAELELGFHSNHGRVAK